MFPPYKETCHSFKFFPTSTGTLLVIIIGTFLHDYLQAACGILIDGRKILLHMELGQKESGDFCTEFLRNMVNRGLNVPVAINSDGAAGMIKAINEVFPHSLRLRCWVHKMKNLSNKLPLEIWEQIKPEVEAIRDSLSYDEGLQRLDQLMRKTENKYPSFIKCLLDDHEVLLNPTSTSRFTKLLKSLNLSFLRSDFHHYICCLKGKLI